MRTPRALAVALIVSASLACAKNGSATPPDAGSSDAGINDAGSSDAGINDAGISDAGMSDAGISDAGSDGGLGVVNDGGYVPFACANADAGSAYDRQESFAAADGTQVTIVVCGPIARPGVVEVGPSDGGPAAQLLASAFAEAIDAGAGTLRLSPGSYDFSDVAADAGSNWLLANATDLVLDGQGAMLVFHGLRSGLFVSHGQRVLLRDLSIDWGDPLAISGTLMKPDAACDGGLAFIADPGFPQDAGSPLPLISMSQFDVATPGWPTTPFQQAHWAQALASQPVYAGNQTYCVGTPQQLSIAPSGSPAIGIARTNGSNALEISGSSEVTLENVNVYASPGVAIAIVNGGRGMALEQVSVKRNPVVAHRLISSNADGVDFRQTLGGILLENSEFTGQGDDGISVVGMFFTVGASSSATQLFLGPADAVPGVLAGDQLDLIDPSTFAPLGSAQVAVTTPVRDGGVTVGLQVTLAAPGLPALAPDGGAFAQLADGGLLTSVAARSSPDFLLRNVSMHDNDERGLLVHAANGLVDHCQLANDVGMILMAQDTPFLEGPGASNVIVQDTTFTNCGVMDPAQTSWICAGGSDSAAPPAPLSIMSITPDADFPFGAPNHGIVLQRNTIAGASGAGILVASASGVTVSDNVLFDTNQVTPDAGCARLAVLPQGSIVATQSSGVAFSGNVRDGGSSLGIAVTPSCQGCGTQSGY